MAKERLAEVRKPAHQKFFWFDGMASRLCLRAQTFFLAFVCWRKGNSELAQQLFDEAARMGPLRLDSDTDLTNPPPMQRELEIEFGIFATGIATFKMGSEFSSFGMAGISQKQVPRAELLRIFRKIVRLYPANPYRKYAQETASVLEKMVAEDKQHKLLTSKEIAKLPLDRRIDELIFQLRDQLGIEPPYSYISNEYTDGTTPAHQLVRIGYPAVPHLIIALGDKRFSRSTGDRGNYVHVCTVGDCATSILQRITGLKSYELAPVTVSDDDAAKSFRRSMEEWWAAFQAKGENEIVDWITSGRVDPVPLVPKLARMPPDLVKHAILIGALKAKGDIAAHGFLEELDKFKTDPVASLIRERLSWWPRLPDLNFDGAFDDLMREAKLETPP